MRITKLAAIVVVLAMPLAGTVRATAERELVGVWDCAGPDLFGAPSRHRMVIDADDRFTRRTVSRIGFVMRWWGRWKAAPDAVRFRVEGWEQRDYVGPQGRRPIDMPDGQSVPVRFVERDAIQTATAVCRRVG